MEQQQPDALEQQIETLADTPSDAELGTCISAEAIPQAWREGYGAAVEAFDAAVVAYCEAGGTTPGALDLLAEIRDQAFDADPPSPELAALFGGEEAQ